MPFYTMQDNEKLYVREFGQGEPILVLSGLGMHSWQWLPFLYHLKNKYHFIIPDWRGFGGSKNCQIPLNLDAISSHWQDLNHLINTQKLDNFKLIGYSMGATTAMHGMKHGDLSTKLKAYLHIDQTPKINVDDSWQYGLFGQQHKDFKILLSKLSTFLHQNSSVKNVEDLDQLKRKELVEMWLEFIQLQSSNKLSPFLFKIALKRPKLQKHILPIHRLDYLTWYIDNYLNHNEDYREAISKLKSPTTFFIGKQSSLYPAEGQLRISKQLQNSHNVIFDKSGHTPLITEPLKFRKEIAKFLTT